MNNASVPSEVQLESWLTEYGDAVLRTCALYLGDRALAQDALQDTFIKVWRGMGKRRGGSAVKTWILRIAINTCKDYRRTAWFRHIDRAKAVEDLPPAAADTTEESRALFLDVMRLPDKYKQAVLLYHYHKLTMAETADILAVSRATVQNRLRKAYALLRCDLEGSDMNETE